MSVVDLKSAYRSVAVYSPHAAFQGFAWDLGEGLEYYINNRLSFGLRCAPNIFNSLSNCIVKIAKSYGVDFLVNYLDDFIILARSEAECLRQRNVVIEVMEFLGFKISHNKLTAPSQRTVFLGITIDSVAMELSLPPEKIVKLKEALEDCLGMQYVHKKGLKKLGV